MKKQETILDHKILQEKKFFPAIQNKEQKEQIEITLEYHNITKICFFDELGRVWENLEKQEELTLLIMPINNIVTDNARDTTRIINMLQLNNITYTPEINAQKVLDIELQSEESNPENAYKMQTARITRYFPTRNLLITEINPFYNEQTIKFFLQDLAILKPKKLKDKEIENYILKRQWKRMIETKINDGEYRLASLEAGMKKSLNETNEYIQEIKTEEKTLTILKEMKKKDTEKLKEEIEAIRKMPMIEEVKVKDNIYITFKDIYVTGQVFDQEIKNGIRTPKLKTEKVKIGKLTFIIKENEIKIENKEAITRDTEIYEHPHAHNGRICFGMIHTEINTALAELELTKVVKLLYAWSISYNDEDKYIPLQFYYNKQKNKETTQEEIDQLIRLSENEE